MYIYIKRYIHIYIYILRYIYIYSYTPPYEWQMLSDATAKTARGAETPALAQALAPLLAKLSLPSWECLQATNLWNLRRPVWVSAIVNILDPFLAPAVSDVLQSLDEGITCTLSHISLAKKLMMENVKDLLGTLLTIPNYRDIHNNCYREFAPVCGWLPALCPLLHPELCPAPGTVCGGPVGGEHTVPGPAHYSPYVEVRRT